MHLIFIFCRDIEGFFTSLTQFALLPTLDLHIFRVEIIITLDVNSVVFYVQIFYTIGDKLAKGNETIELNVSFVRSNRDTRSLVCKRLDNQLEHNGYQS